MANGSNIFDPDDENRVAVLLTWHHMGKIEGLLADVPFKDANPLYRALLDLAAHRVVTGLQALAQGALHTHSERQALMTLAPSEKPLN